MIGQGHGDDRIGRMPAPDFTSSPPEMGIVGVVPLEVVLQADGQCLIADAGEFQLVVERRHAVG